MATADRLRQRWEPLAVRQEGALSRSQALACGLTDGMLATEQRARRWQRPFAGVYVTFSGPLPERTRVWAALLAAGRGAVASHATAAWLDGLRDEAPAQVWVTVPWTRRLNPLCGVRVRRSRHVLARGHPGHTVPRTRVEDTVLDLVHAATRADEVVDIVTRACQRRRTTAARLGDTAAARPRLRWRPLLAELLEDASDGAMSALERRWRRDVERAHRLPRGERNRLQRPSGGRSVYHDVRYPRWRTIVELDGRAAHPFAEAFRDRARDNRVVLAGQDPLRYGWHEVVNSACACAAELAALLQRNGWPGTPRRCGPACLLADASRR